MPASCSGHSPSCAAMRQPQERDEIFEDFKAACQRQGLQLRFLNGASAAAQSGDEPLLLVIGEDADQLQRFPVIDGGDSAAPAAEQAGGGGSTAAAAATSVAAGEAASS